MSGIVHRPRPRPESFVMSGADQPCRLDPCRYSAILSPPSNDLGVWQAPQCAGPSTRNAPRFHSGDRCGSPWYSPSLKYSMSHTRIVARILKGNGSWCATTELTIEGTVLR